MTRRGTHRRVVVISDAERRAAATSGTPDAGEVAASALPGPAMPSRAREDIDEAWGDGPDTNDRRLLDDVPPHWGVRER